jgi:hypothetical protein
MSETKNFQDNNFWSVVIYIIFCCICFMCQNNQKSQNDDNEMIGFESIRRYGDRNWRK